MKLTLHIALKFLFGKKSKGIINVISTISIVGVGVGSVALLVVLSVFNGLQGLIGDFYGSFDPDIRIEAVDGKYFSMDSLDMEAIRKIDEIACISPLIEDNALLKYNKRQEPAIVMGVDSTFTQVSHIDTIMTDGKFNLKDKHGFGGAIGYVLADKLNVRLTFLTALVIYVPQKDKKINLMRPTEAFNSHYIHPKGIFLVKQQEYDSRLLVDIDLIRRLFNYKKDEVSALAISLKPGASISKVQEVIRNIVGGSFSVKNQQEQHEGFHKMLQIEKIMAYLILSFILVIAAFNLIGTMSMLIFDKKEGIKILKSLGADQKMVTRVFLLEGWLISLIGVFAGVSVGIILVLVQQHFGIIKFAGGGSFVVKAYPIALHLGDILATIVTVITIGFLATLYPVKVIVKKYFNSFN